MARPAAFLAVPAVPVAGSVFVGPVLAGPVAERAAGLVSRVSRPARVVRPARRVVEAEAVVRKPRPVVRRAAVRRVFGSRVVVAPAPGASTRVRVARRPVVRRAAVRRPVSAVRGGMSAVVRYALAQVGKRYVYGAAGPWAYDCSGLTMMAYRQAGIRLPHQSGGQSARAYRVSRASARPGDLVVGRGHVGVYVGGGMMVDAGNPGVGVVRRRLYGGLWIERLR